MSSAQGLGEDLEKLLNVRHVVPVVRAECEDHVITACAVWPTALEARELSPPVAYGSGVLADHAPASIDCGPEANGCVAGIRPRLHWNAVLLRCPIVFVLQIHT